MSTTQKFRLAFTDAKPYDKASFNAFLSKPEFSQLEIVYMESRLNSATVSLFTDNFDGVCCFVNDKLTADVLRTLKASGVGVVLLRCAGFDMVDLPVCETLGISVARVPAYSPHAVAEFAMASLLTLNRNIHKAYNRVRDGNFTLNGLVGTDLYGKTVGIVGTGKIGQCFANIAIGFGCRILAYDIFICEELKKRPEVTYVELEQLFRESDFISLHAPLTAHTEYMVNAKTLRLMKPTCMLVNTSRGKLIKTKDLVEALLNHQLGGATLDVYFFNDVSDRSIKDELLARLLNMRNVIVTAHQAFLTREALDAIASTTLTNWLQYFVEGKRQRELTNAVASA